jgi:hypothetical protein
LHLLVQQSTLVWQELQVLLSLQHVPKRLQLLQKQIHLLLAAAATTAHCIAVTPHTATDMIVPMTETVISLKRRELSHHGWIQGNARLNAFQAFPVHNTCVTLYECNTSHDNSPGNSSAMTAGYEAMPGFTVTPSGCRPASDMSTPTYVRGPGWLKLQPVPTQTPAGR